MKHDCTRCRHSGEKSYDGFCLRRGCECHCAPRPKTPPRYSYDERCEDLARVFLDEHEPHPAEIAELAQTIQNAIEDWLNEWLNR